MIYPIPFEKLDGNPASVNLVMVSGADNRANPIRGTFNVCHNVFTNILLTDTGSTDDTLDVAREFDAEILHAELMKDGPILPLAHEGALRSIPVGEWIYLCDSDERPSSALLKAIPRLVQWGNEYGISGWSLPCNGHWFDREGTLVGDSVLKLLDGDIRDMSHGSTAFHSMRLLKRTEELAIDYTGSHYAFVNGKPAVFYPLPWNHYKGEKSRCQSTFIHALTHPIEHNFTGPEAGDWICYQMNNSIGMTQIAQWSAVKEIPVEVADIISKWGQSDNEVARVIHDHVYVHGFDGTEPECKEACCRYDS